MNNNLFLPLMEKDPALATPATLPPFGEGEGKSKGQI